jgi:hypothetical protein
MLSIDCCIVRDDRRCPASGTDRVQYKDPHINENLEITYV